jgi:hypothetical protein
VHHANADVVPQRARQASVKASGLPEFSGSGTQAEHVHPQALVEARVRLATEHAVPLRDDVKTYRGSL